MSKSCNTSPPEIKVPAQQLNASHQDPDAKEGLQAYCEVLHFKLKIMHFIQRQIVEIHHNSLDDLQSQKTGAPYEQSVIRFTNAIVQPLAMVVKFITASIASPAVLRMVFYHKAANITMIMKLWPYVVHSLLVLLVKALVIYGVVSGIADCCLVAVIEESNEKQTMKYETYQ